MCVFFSDNSRASETDESTDTDANHSDSNDSSNGSRITDDTRASHSSEDGYNDTINDSVSHQSNGDATFIVNANDDVDGGTDAGGARGADAGSASAGGSGGRIRTENSNNETLSGKLTPLSMFPESNVDSEFRLMLNIT